MKAKTNDGDGGIGGIRTGLWGRILCPRRGRRCGGGSGRGQGVQTRTQSRPVMTQSDESGSAGGFPAP